MDDAVKSYSLLDAANWHRVGRSPVLSFHFFPKLFDILILQDSSYFSHNSWLISQLKSVPFSKFHSWKVFRSEDINENVSGYMGPWLRLHSRI